MQKYTITKVNTDNVAIDSPLWLQVKTASIGILPWAEQYPYKPNTTAKIVYSDNGMTVLLETDEKDLRATYKNPNDPVCRDSCMEFFLQPDANTPGYLNFEINPLGTLYLGFGKDRYDSKPQTVDVSIFDIQSKITEEKWQLKLYIPFSFLKQYVTSITNPFMGNLYKCGDETGHAHYVVWNNIELPNPDYHRPEFFGEFYFAQG